MKCIVTGGLGFIGSHVVDKLISKGHEVKIIDNESTGSIKNLNKQAAYIHADITKLEEIEPHFKNIDCVFHLAAYPRIGPSFEDPVKFLNVNVAGTINCLLSSKKHNVKKFIFSSSSSVYGNKFKLPTEETNELDPLSPYAAQKLESELYCKIFSETYNMKIIALRYFNVFGPRSFNEKDPFSAYSSPVGIFIRQKKAGQKLTITWDGEQKRDYIYVKEVAEANYHAAMAELENNFEIINVGSGENYTVNEIAETVGGETTYIPKREGEARVTLASIEKAKKLIKWSPKTTFKEAILETMKVDGLPRT